MQIYSNAVSTHPVFDVGFPPVRPMRLVSFVRHVFAIAEQRRQLAELSDQQLADVGLTRDEALAEAGRPFWDLPANQMGGL